MNKTVYILECEWLVNENREFFELHFDNLKQLDDFRNYQKQIVSNFFIYSIIKKEVIFDCTKPNLKLKKGEE